MAGQFRTVQLRSRRDICRIRRQDHAAGLVGYRDQRVVDLLQVNVCHGDGFTVSSPLEKREETFLKLDSLSAHVYAHYD